METSNFFERQESARYSTRLLVCYFLVSVLLIVLAVYFLILLVFFWASSGGQSSSDISEVLLNLWKPRLFTWTAFYTLLLITSSSLYKIWRLGSGGKAVAELLGGRLINPNSTHLLEGRVVNVVEEMAIASGVSVPPVYLLEDENSINAFAAGYTPRDAVVGISSGALNHLNREELQGVIAHEFSHILNGDMRLNIRLIGLLHGILVLALAGRCIVRSGSYQGRRYNRRRNSKGGGPQLAIFGILLILIGYVGVVFGKLIKSAVSRQREFLADASAVQFTRNPDGISGALKKIGGFQFGSVIVRPNAEEISHMFFSEALGSKISGFFATHPPLVDRIKAIEPGFDGRFVDPKRFKNSDQEKLQERPRPSAKKGMFSVETILGSIGSPGLAHISLSSNLLSSLPKKLMSRLHEPHGACATVFALLLDQESADIKKHQLSSLAANTAKGIYSEVIVLDGIISSLPDRARLPVLELTLPALRQLSTRQYEGFRSVVKELVKADEKCSLFEYVLQVVLLRHLEPNYYKRAAIKIRFGRMEQVAKEAATIISVIATASELRSEPPSLAAMKDSYEAGMKRVGIENISFETKGVCLKSLDLALKRFAQATPGVKKNLVEACIQTINRDGKVEIEEFELLRAVAESLDCPIPPYEQELS